MKCAAKFQVDFDVELLRRGCNQLGVLVIAAGLVAFFTDNRPKTTMPIDYYLSLIFVFIFVGGLVLFAPWWNNRQARKNAEEKRTLNR